MSGHFSSLRGNLWKLNVIEICDGALFIVPVFVLFFQENGLTLQQIFLLQGIFAAVLTVLEIPSGYLSDRWGRRNTLILSNICSFCAIFIYAVSSGFSGFALGEILIAIGVSLSSGTTEAMTYDTLFLLGEERSFRRIDGHQRFLYFLGEAGSSVIAGFIALVSLRATAWTTLLPFGLSILFSLMLHEPERHKLQETRHVKILWGITTHTLLRSAPLRSIVAIHALLSTSTLALFWFTQPYQTEVGLPLTLFGIVHAAIVTMGALATKYTHTMERLIDDRIFLVWITVGIIASMLALSAVSTLWGLFFFFVARAGWGFLSPLTSDLVNRMTDSSIRATVLSVKAFAHRLLFAAAAPFLGALGDLYTLSTAFLLMGAIVSGGAILLFLLTKKAWGEIPS